MSDTPDDLLPVQETALRARAEMYREAGQYFAWRELSAAAEHVAVAVQWLERREKEERVQR